MEHVSSREERIPPKVRLEPGSPPDKIWRNQHEALPTSSNTAWSPAANSHSYVMASPELDPQFRHSKRLDRAFTWILRCARGPAVWICSLSLFSGFIVLGLSHGNDYIKIWSVGNPSKRSHFECRFKRKLSLGLFKSKFSGNKSLVPFRDLKSSRPMSVSQRSWIQPLILKDLNYLTLIRLDSEEIELCLTDISENADSIGRQTVFKT